PAGGCRKATRPQWRGPRLPTDPDQIQQTWKGLLRGGAEAGALLRGWSNNALRGHPERWVMKNTPMPGGKARSKVFFFEDRGSRIANWRLLSSIFDPRSSILNLLTPSPPAAAALAPATPAPAPSAGDAAAAPPSSSPAPCTGPKSSQTPARTTAPGPPCRTPGT